MVSFTSQRDQLCLRYSFSPLSRPTTMNSAFPSTLTFSFILILILILIFLHVVDVRL